MERVTLYFRSEFGFGITKVEAKVATVSVKPYAQYERGIFVEFKRARERRMRGFVQAYGPSLVVLEGWGHLNPDGMWVEERVMGDVTTSESRYSSCDPRWQSDFDSKLEAYLADKPATVVLHDFRKHQPGCRGMISSCPCCS